MDREKLVRALNEWMRRYTENPAAFEAEFATVSRFLAEAADGVEPSYGETSVRYMETLVA